MTVLLTAAQVAAELGISPQTLKTWVKRGRLPEPVTISPVCRRWPEETIRPAIERLKAERSAATIA